MTHGRRTIFLRQPSNCPKLAYRNLSQSIYKQEVLQTWYMLRVQLDRQLVQIDFWHPQHSPWSGISAENETLRGHKTLGISEMAKLLVAVNRSATILVNLCKNLCFCWLKHDFLNKFQQNCASRAIGKKHAPFSVVDPQVRFSSEQQISSNFERYKVWLQTQPKRTPSSSGAIKRLASLWAQTSSPVILSI